jgi:hypothetical protein
VAPDRQTGEVVSELPASQKVSHESVDYKHPSPYIRSRCGTCEHFIKANPPRCEHVANPIRAEDYCDKFERK